MLYPLNYLLIFGFGVSAGDADVGSCEIAESIGYHQKRAKTD